MLRILSHLEALEAEAVFIMRETAAEFERRYTSSIPRDAQLTAGRVGNTPRWQRGLEEAVGRLAERKRVYRPDEELVELV